MSRGSTVCGAFVQPLSNYFGLLFASSASVAVIAPSPREATEMTTRLYYSAVCKVHYAVSAAGHWLWAAPWPVGVPECRCFLILASAHRQRTPATDQSCQWPVRLGSARLGRVLPTAGVVLRLNGARLIHKQATARCCHAAGKREVRTLEKAVSNPPLLAVGMERGAQDPRLTRVFFGSPESLHPMLDLDPFSRVCMRETAERQTDRRVDHRSQ